MTHQPTADALVLFGATGDLAKRKLFPSLYSMEANRVLRVPVVGVARSDWTDDSFRDHARESVLAARPDVPSEQRGAGGRAGRPDGALRLSIAARTTPRGWTSRRTRSRRRPAPGRPSRRGHPRPGAP